MKTPEQILSEITDLDIRYFSNFNDRIIRITLREALSAIEAYHDQFTQSYAYKAMPPAVDRSVEPNKTMPSREDAKAWLLAEMDLDPYNEYHEIYIDTAMAMYDYLKPTENNLK